MTAAASLDRALALVDELRAVLTELSAAAPSSSPSSPSSPSSSPSPAPRPQRLRVPLDGSALFVLPDVVPAALPADRVQLDDDGGYALTPWDGPSAPRRGHGGSRPGRTVHRVPGRPRGYTGVREALRRTHGPAAVLACVVCGARGAFWCYDQHPADPFVTHDDRGRVFSQDFTRYAPACSRRCATALRAHARTTTRKDPQP